ncbi:MAG: 2-amino-4-hydroxy-6-hydroxymethyldihydropteridine diphosphokinase [Betaproteobacteria bacterium]|nr:MAG: 2-amino-4-hydroxy-6-hydroxymethyldihydropteridine diphosphokinase [Betaproteobacteria bacterium]
MHIAFIALGSNLDHPESKVRLGLAALAGLPQVQLVAASSLYRSAAFGHADQPDFINAVARLSTGLAPRALLAALLAIERRCGRERSFRNAPRTLDLDLLLYDAQSIAEPGLAVPHPRMHERAFVLAPLLEIAPACVIPGRGPAADWLARYADQPIVRLAAR